VRRREVLLVLGAAGLWPCIAFAQAKPVRIAFIGSGAAQSSSIFSDGLKQGLAENGLVEERDYTLDVRWAEGEYARFLALAADVAKQGPQVIPATTIAAVRAVQPGDTGRHDHDQRSGGSRAHREPGAAWRQCQTIVGHRPDALLVIS
jgi:putative ABC transport system substrate-binding protein